MSDQDRSAGRTGAAPRMRPWLRVVLLLSLAANLAVVGGFAGMMLLGSRDGPPGPPRGRDYVFPYTRALDEPQREALDQRLRGAFERDETRERNGGESRRGFLAPYHDGVEALRRDPFDRAAFAATLQAQSAEAERRQRTGQEILVEFVASLPPAERLAYADRLEARIVAMTERMRHHKR